MVKVKWRSAEWFRECRVSLRWGTLRVTPYLNLNWGQFEVGLEFWTFTPWRWHASFRLTAHLGPLHGGVMLEHRVIGRLHRLKERRLKQIAKGTL